MVNQHANYYGTLLLVLVVVLLVGIFTEPQTTGLVVKEIEQEYHPLGEEIQITNQKTCADNSFYGECSTILKGKFCLNGNLVDYCELCGCDGICSNHECVKE